jgi:hypothetical protein
MDRRIWRATASVLGLLIRVFVVTIANANSLLVARHSEPAAPLLAKSAGAFCVITPTVEASQARGSRDVRAVDDSSIGLGGPPPPIEPLKLSHLSATRDDGIHRCLVVGSENGSSNAQELTRAGRLPPRKLARRRGSPHGFDRVGPGGRYDADDVRALWAAAYRSYQRATARPADRPARQKLPADHRP